MYLHYFESVKCLVIVSKKKIIMVSPENVKQHIMDERFETGIDCASFDDTKGRIAVSSKRNLTVISSPHGNIVKQATLERNCSTLTWISSSDILIAGDKSGSIWEVSMESEPNLLASRVAVVLSLAVCSKDSSQFLAVGDRDGRLSVFHYPASHNLHSVCLGHEQYIASLILPFPDTDPHLLITLGGDGRICLWNVVSGDCISRVELFPEKSEITCKDRPKIAVFVPVDNKEGSSHWIVIGEESSFINGFSLKRKADSFVLSVEEISAMLNSYPVSSTSIAMASVCENAVIFIERNDNKSVWPWKTVKIKETSTASELINKFEEFMVKNNYELGLELSPLRNWLERNPHQSVTEYYAKRKKAKMSLKESTNKNGNSESEPDSD